MTEPLIHLIYTSAAVGEPSPADIAELLRVSRRNNERAGITGMLLHTDGTYFQVLEGPVASVESTLAAIAGDARHSGVVTIIRERIARRSFPGWTMGHVTATMGEVAAGTGLNDFFGDGSCFDRLDAGRAKKLLAAFRSGRWRAAGHDNRTHIAQRRAG